MGRPASRLKLEPPGPPEPLSVQVTTRLTPNSRETIKAVADENGVTVQALGLYAWSLALRAYGKPPLPEAR